MPWTDPPPLIGEVKRYIPDQPNALYPALLFILEESRKELARLGSQDGENQLFELVSGVSHRLGFELTPVERDEILSLLEKESRSFGILQELVDNENISDIIISHYGRICIQQDRKNVATKLYFPNQLSYEAFVEKLLHRAGTTYSTKQPIADGMIGSFVRVHAVHKSIAENGPYLTLRLNRYETISTDDLITAGLAPKEIFNYLEAIVLAGRTVLIAGEVGTGKTTLVRALAAQMSPDESILVIEDTPEIKLEHPHVRYLTTRNNNSEGMGRVSPSEVIRAGMRMAMNRIIFGEIRDAEAAESLIDVCASGHSGMSTLHARSAVEAVSRLQLFLGRAQPGVEHEVLTEQIVTAVHVIVHIEICKETFKRRINEVREIGPVADGTIRQRTIFQYRPDGETPLWKVSNRMSAHKEHIEERCSLHKLPATLSLSTTSGEKAR